MLFCGHMSNFFQGLVPSRRLSEFPAAPSLTLHRFIVAMEVIKDYLCVSQGNQYVREQPLLLRCKKANCARHLEGGCCNAEVITVATILCVL